MLRIWPHRIDGEGHFVCRLRKQGSISHAPTAAAPDRRSKKRRTGRDSAPDAGAVLGRLRDTIELPALNGTPALYGPRLYMLPEGCPELDGVRVARAGLELCEVGRSHVEPAYALGRALAPDSDSVGVNTRDALRLVRGEAVTADARNGWVLVHWRGLPVCFGKARDGAIKSHFPRGLKPLGLLAEESQ